MKYPHAATALLSFALAVPAIAAGETADACGKQCYDAYTKCLSATEGQSHRNTRASCNSDYFGCLKIEDPNYFVKKNISMVSIAVSCNTTTSTKPGTDATKPQISTSGGDSIKPALALLSLGAMGSLFF
ncbi:hypothetical protein CDD83_9980 [Cordyceps sp. RAO-2017]|nr:hypothetical protein CDD83_9980 [Cordyceps sp. RAO-2017]